MLLTQWVFVDVSFLLQAMQLLPTVAAFVASLESCGFTDALLLYVGVQVSLATAALWLNTQASFLQYQCLCSQHTCNNSDLWAGWIP